MPDVVSVIIPAFNRVNYINQTVDCVLNQTFQSFELIVIDDGSTDGTYEKLQEYGSRISLLTHKNHANKGQSASINVGLSHAQGRYIIVLDSDDFWELNKLQVQVEYLEKHPNIGLLYTNGYGTDENGNIVYVYHSDTHMEPNDPNQILLDCYLALPVNAMVRKTVYDQVGGFNEAYRAAQDHDMLVRISEVTDFAYLPDFLFYYRRHSNSISHQNLETRWRVGFKILKSAAERFPYKRSTLRKRRAVLYFRLAQVYMSQNKFLKAAIYLIAAGMLDPARSLSVLLKKEAVA